MKILAVLSHVDLPEAHMLAGLPEQGIVPLVLCKSESRNLHILEKSGVPFKNIRLSGRVDRKSVRTIRAAVKTFEPEVIHSFNKKALISALLATSGQDIRHITYRGIVGNLSPWNPESKLTYFNARVERVVCVCDAVRESLVTIGMPPAKAVRIYKGHNPAWYQAWPRTKLLQEHDIPDNKVVLGSSAHWRPRKGLGLLLGALSLLKHPDLYLLLAGNVDKRITRQIKRDPYLNERVRLAGNIADVPARIGACDFFVMPSLRREGLAKSVIEAMIQGVPAIVSNCGGLPEMVTHNQSGLIVTPGDRRELAQAITQLADDAALRSRLGQGAKEQMLTTFSTEQTVRQHVDLYRLA